MIGPLPEGLVRCVSCGGPRTREQVRRALDFSWRTLPDQYVCEDAGWCFHTMRARPFDTGRLTADGLGRIVKTVRVREED